MEGYKLYRKKKIQALRPYVEGEDVTGVSISDADKEAGSPKVGDMIAVAIDNHEDAWLVNEKFFIENYVLI